MLSSLYSVTAQQHAKITVVVAGYETIGQSGPHDNDHFNRILQATLSRSEYFQFMEIVNIDPNDRNRIRRQVGQTGSHFMQQDFNYTVIGDIIINSGRYNIRTVLMDNRTTQSREWFGTGIFDILDTESTIEAHGKEIAEFLRYMPLSVTIDNVRNAIQDGNYEEARLRINIIRFKYGDSIELRDIEWQLQEDREVASEKKKKNPRAIEILSRANSLIELALVARLLSDGDRYYQQSYNLLNSLSEDENEEYQDSIKDIKRKMERYKERIREFNTGGIEFAYFRPLLWNEFIIGESILDYYPDIFGLSLTWFIPVYNTVRVFNQPYIRFAYLGFGNNAVEKAIYLENAAIYVLSLSGGYNFSWMLTRYIFPSFFVGAGYRHFIEYAQDMNSEAFLNSGQLHYEGGLGFKVHIPTVNLMLSTNIGVDFGTGEPMTVGINFHFGLAYLFHGKRRTF
jgi:hypothetical protein